LKISNEHNVTKITLHYTAHPASESQQIWVCCLLRWASAPHSSYGRPM